MTVATVALRRSLAHPRESNLTLPLAKIRFPHPHQHMFAAPGAANLLDHVMRRAQETRLQFLDTPMVLRMPNTNFSPDELPMIPFAYTTKVVSVLDVTWAYAENLDLHEVEDLLRRRKYEDLPEVLQPSASPGVPVRMQLLIHPNGDGTHFVLKHFSFLHRVAVDIAKTLVRGAAYSVTVLCANPQKNQRAWQIALESVGGLGLFWSQVLPLAPDADEATKLVDEGFDFIEAQFPKDATEFQQCRWIQRNLKRESGPLAGWARSDVEKATRALVAQGCLAKTRTSHSLTYMSVDPCFRQHILNQVLPLCHRRGVIFLGKANAGKTPVALTLAFAFSRWNIIYAHGLDREPRCRSAPDLDFFRGAPGTVDTPFIFDDGDVQTQPVTKLKAFLDVGEEEAMTRERWGASKYVQGQLRIVCDNAFDQNADRDLPPIPFGQASDTVPMHVFMDIVKPAWPKTGFANVEALLKRASIIVNTERFVYLKLAASPNIQRFNKYPSYLSSNGGARWHKQDTSGCKATVSKLQHIMEVDWEHRYFQAVLEGGDVQALEAERRDFEPPSQTSETQFYDVAVPKSPTMTQEAAVAATPAAPSAERRPFFRRLASSVTQGASIDLD